MVEIFFGVLVLAVAVLMAVDVARTPDESLFRPAGMQAPDAGRAFTAVPAVPAVTEFPREPSTRQPSPREPSPRQPSPREPSPREPAAPAIPATARDAAPPRRPESAGPQAGSRQPSPAGPPAVRQGPGRALKNWRVSSRLWLLAGIPAVAVAVVAFCVVRIVGALDGASINSPVGSVRSGAVTSAVGFGVAAVVVLALAAWFAIAAARSVLRPLGRLRAGAVEMPDVVRRIGEGRGQGRLPDVKPVDVDSSDELGEVARAFEAMRSQTLRMAANEATVRGTLSTMFTNLSHRSQSLVERQIRLIESMEQTEQDPGRLASLSKMDRIAARMHRSSQNLLVLAGHELSSRWHQPVALVGIIRAAMSEIEDDERVSVSAQPDIAVRGPAVNDVVHLLAELTENATSFSAGDMAVDVSGQLLTTGGALIEITDRGIGMSPKDMAYANWQLENAQAPDVNVPRWMGLFVVARLAARHGIRVRLQPAAFGGLTALVWLPDEILTNQGAAASPRLSEAAAARSDPGTAGPVTGTAADPRYAAVGHRASTVTLPEFAPAGDRVPAPPPAPASSAPGETEVSPQFSTPLVTAATGSQATGSPNSDVIVPPAEGPSDPRRLPIFDQVESRWFGAGWVVPERAAPGGRWASPGDEGWHAAQSADLPTSAGSTPAGLPKRMPAANLVPGAVPSTPPSAAPARSASEVRDRLTGFQRGVSEGRAVAGEAADQDADDQA